MAQRKTLTVSITREQGAFVRGGMASGRFASASELIRAASQFLQTQEAKAQHGGVARRDSDGTTSHA